MTRDQNLPILLSIEDSDEDFNSFMLALKDLCFEYPVYRCADGDEAIDFLTHQGDFQNPDTPSPHLIVLDLNLPATDGREVLHWIKSHHNLSIIPVVVFTTSANQQDIDFCYEKGVNSYLLKPMGYLNLKQKVNVLIQYWFQQVILPAV